MDCSTCGQQISGQDRFCRHCGGDQLGGPRPSPSAPPPPAPSPSRPAPPSGPALSDPALANPALANPALANPGSGPHYGAAAPPAAPPPSGYPTTNRFPGPGGGGERSINPGLIAGIVGLAVVLLAGIVFIGSRGGGDDVASVDGTATTEPAPAVASIPAPPPIAVPPGGFTADQVNQTFGDAIWKVQTDGCGGEGHGTGFAISPRHVVTNWHVVVGDTEPMLMSHDGTRTIAGHVIGLSQKPDVAVIEVDEDLPLYVGWTETTGLIEGQPLVALGFPLPQGNYTVTQLAIASFELAGENRTGILVDGRIDRGNSGGPSMTTDGKVAGINTAVNVNGISEGGLQTVPYLTSYDAVRANVDEFVKKTGGPTVPADCAKAGDFKQAKTYGDNPQLDVLWDYCDTGDANACDALAQNATPQSDYYLFGVTCGARVGREGYCAARYGPELPPN